MNKMGKVDGVLLFLRANEKIKIKNKKKYGICYVHVDHA